MICRQLDRHFVTYLFHFCMSLGQPDPNAPQTIANARAAGIPYVDVYMFPCPTCSASAGEQVREMVNELSSSNYEQIWLDVEVCKLVYAPMGWPCKTTDSVYIHVVNV